MKLESPRRFTPGDYPESPAWFHRYADLQNDTLEQVTHVLQRNVGSDNLNEEVRELEIEDDVAFEIQLQALRGAPIGAWAVWVKGLRHHYPLIWEPLGSRRIRCKLKFLSAPGARVLVRILVRGA